MAFKMKKTMLTSLATVMLSSIVLAACGGNSDKPADSASSAPSAKPVKKDIKVLLSHNNSGFASKGPDDKKNKYYQELSKLSGYNVSYEFLGHDIDFRQQLSLRFASGELPDLVRTASIDWDVHQGAVDRRIS